MNQTQVRTHLLSQFPAQADDIDAYIAEFEHQEGV